MENESHTRESKRRMYVASAIADDYEQLQQVVTDTRRWAAEDGIAPFTSEELLSEIGDLIRGGYASAYLLSPEAPHVVPVGKDYQGWNDVWYLLTSNGQALLNKLREG
jgi:hypothetical protein